MPQTICSFSLQFPPLAGVDFVRLDDNSLQFQLRVEHTTTHENQRNSIKISNPKSAAERVIVTEAQLGLILGLIEAHRRAHAPPQ